MRLADNEALALALSHAGRVIPIFILDSNLLNSQKNSQKRVAFLFAGLRELNEDLQARGSRLIVRSGQPAEILDRIMHETDASAIYAEEDYSPYARERDQRIAAGLPLYLTGSVAIRPPNTILKQDGTPYTVFTPFSRAWLSSPLPRAAQLIPAPQRLPDPGAVNSEPIPAEPRLLPDNPFPSGEKEATRRLRSFVDNLIENYDDTRNRVDLAGTSRLSPYLRFGMISPRQTAIAALEAKTRFEAGNKGSFAWLNELIWRDFYIHILYHFPHVSRTSFRENLRDIPWRNDPAEFKAWCAGQTGYPIVDAAMRQLATSGWIHNRARMIAASFLVKDLLIDWRWGEQWFMQNLVDGDPAANNGGWQWTAGTGTDAAPYFRIFNPVTQGKKFDPQGAYIRQWVPELAAVDTRYIHEPWTMTPIEQETAGLRIGRNYPRPIVDHAIAREQTLAAYQTAKALHP
jgi:deoxyribodipyrimidine photo-lyase